MTYNSIQEGNQTKKIIVRKSVSQMNELSRYQVSLPIGPGALNKRYQNWPPSTTTTTIHYHHYHHYHRYRPTTVLRTYHIIIKVGGKILPGTTISSYIHN